MFAEIFVLGSLWFWVLSAIGICALSAMIANEKFGLGTFALVGYFAAIVLLGNFQLMWFVTHPLPTLLGILGYLLIGSGWSFFKYYLMLSNLKHQYKLMKADYIANNNKGASWDDYINNGHHYTNSALGKIHKLKAGGSYEYNKIVGWMIHWPFSIISTLLTDFVKAVFDQIYIMVYKLFASVKTRVLGDIFKELA